METLKKHFKKRDLIAIGFIVLWLGLGITNFFSGRKFSGQDMGITQVLMAFALSIIYFDEIMYRVNKEWTDKIMKLTKEILKAWDGSINKNQEFLDLVKKVVKPTEDKERVVN